MSWNWTNEFDDVGQMVLVPRIVFSTVRLE